MTSRATGRRVLLVINSAHRRGAELQAFQLAGCLREHGAVVDICALRAGGPTATLPVSVLGQRKFGLPTLWRLRRKARAADLVIAFGSSTLPASILALLGRSSPPLVYRNISHPEHWLRGPTHRWLTALQYRRPVKIAALWSGAGATIGRRFGVRPEDIVIIPNARHDHDFPRPSPSERIERREEFGLGDRPTVAFIGSLTPEKRVDLAIDAIAELPDHHLVIAGDGPERTRAAALAATVAPGRVRFLGAVEAVSPLLQAVDAAMITSDVEGMPGIAIEAALTGTPVVGRDVGALADMPFVELADADPAAMAAAIRRAPVPDLEEVRTFTWPMVTDLWLDLIEGVAAARPRPRAGLVRRAIRRGQREVGGLVLRVMPSRGVVTHVATHEPLFALTFDDGPDHSTTPQILDALKTHGARATFFVLGERAHAHRDLLARMRDAGHEVACHSWDHQSLVVGRSEAGGEWIREQLERALAAMTHRPRLFRAPFGHLDRVSRRAVARCGMDAIGWNVDPRDYLGSDGVVLSSYVLERVGPGSIVLLHDHLDRGYDSEAFDRSATVEAVEQILRSLDGRLRCVGVSELMSSGVARRSWPRAPDGWSPPAMRGDGARRGP